MEVCLISMIALDSVYLFIGTFVLKTGYQFLYMCSMQYFLNMDQRSSLLFISSTELNWL